MEKQTKIKIYQYAVMALLAGGLAYTGFRTYNYFASKKDNSNNSDKRQEGGDAQSLVDKDGDSVNTGQTSTPTPTTDVNVIGKKAYTSRSRDAEVRKTKEDDSGILYANNVKTFDKGGLFIGTIVEVVPSGKPGVVMYKVKFPEPITDWAYGGSFEYGYVNFKNVTIK